MAVVALSIGSNIDPAANINRAVNSLKDKFGKVMLSSVYESRAVGFDGDNFLNLVALIDIEVDLNELGRILKSLEDQQGRDRSADKFSGRTLDIDVLTYDELCGCYNGVVLPRPEITDNAFVLLPLAELLPDSVHPLTNKTFHQLWAEYDKSRQSLWKINFDWHDD